MNKRPTYTDQQTLVLVQNGISAGRQQEREAVAGLLSNHIEVHVDRAQARLDDYLRSQKTQRLASWAIAQELRAIIDERYPDLRDDLTGYLRSAPENMPADLATEQAR